MLANVCVQEFWREKPQQVDFHLDQKLVNVWSIQYLSQLLPDDPFRFISFVNLLQRPYFRQDILEAITDALNQFIKVETLQHKAIKVRFVQYLECSQCAENVLHNREHLTCFRS